MRSGFSIGAETDNVNLRSVPNGQEKKNKMANKRKEKRHLTCF